MDTIDLLWRHASGDAPVVRRGRRPQRSVDQVVDAAVEVADRVGVRFTVRDVAEAMSAPVMSLYSYVDSRDQLLELVIDHCRAVMPRSELTGDWRARLSSVAADNFALFAAHPWLADIETERAVLGPGTLAKYEHELAAVDELELPDPDKDSVLTLVIDFVRSSARSIEHGRRESLSESAEQWWDREGRKLRSLGVTDRFPLASRVGTATGQARGAANDAQTAYSFGLDVILNGVASIKSARQR